MTDIHAQAETTFAHAIDIYNALSDRHGEEEIFSIVANLMVIHVVHTVDRMHYGTVIGGLTGAILTACEQSEAVEAYSEELH